MKKSELKVGVDYAIGAPDDRRTGRLKRATIFELDGERELKYGGRRRGIVMRFAGPPHGTGYVPGGGKVVEGSDVEFVLPNARAIQMTWNDYLPVFLEVQRRREARNAEDTRLAAVGARTVDRLEGIGLSVGGDSGIDFGPWGATWKLTQDALADLLTRLGVPE